MNEETAVHCSECATPFVVDVPSAPLLARTVESSLRLGILNGLGSLLIVLALCFVVGRIYAQYQTAHMHIPQHASSILFTNPRPAPVVLLVAAVPILFVCRSRSQEQSTGTITAVVTICIAAFLILLVKFEPMMIVFWNLPAGLVFIGRDSVSPIIFYFGAVVQIAIGARLITWLHKGSSSDEKVVACIDN